MTPSYKEKILFVCSRNRCRSLTAEKIFAGFDQYDVASAGTESGSRTRVTAGVIGWADWIFVMEKKHLHFLKAKFSDELAGKTVICLHIPDDFEFMDEELIEILGGRLSEYIDVPD